MPGALRDFLRAPATVPLLLVAAALLCLALATFAEGKRLWAAYNAVGATLALALAVVLWWQRLELPRAAALVCLGTAMLHYVGGAVGGPGINGMYAAVPWWDRVTHFAGAAGVAVLALGLLRAASRRDGGWTLPASALALFAFCLAVAVGVGVELFEFGAWAMFGTIDQGFYSNTMMDLFDDATGAAFGAALAHAWTRARALVSPAADAGPSRGEPSASAQAD